MGIFSISVLTYRLRTTLLFAAGLLFGEYLVSAQEPALKSTMAAEKYLSARGEVIIRFAKPSRVSLDEITTFLSIDGLRNDTITAYANEAGFSQFLRLNIAFEVLQPPSLRSGIFKPYRLAADTWQNRYPSYDEYLALLAGFATKYPSLCRLTEFGTSIHGRKLLALKITDNPGVREKEPVVFYTSTIHGDETLGYVLALRLIEHLLVNYNSDALVKHLVDHIEIWINPLANPDGTFFISDTSIAGATRFNINHQDLNRDFPKLDDLYWEDKLRQPETKAMMNFMEGIRPALAANFHGGAELVNYPWDTWSRLHADDLWYRYISRSYVDTVQAYGPSGYMTAENNGITNGYQWYVIYGSRQDYVNHMLHGREVTIELSVDKIPAEGSLNDYWNYNKQSLLQYIGRALTGVTGEITDSITKQPLRAQIIIENHDVDSSFAIADASDGIYYRLTRPGIYSFLITSPGYLPKRMPVSVTDGELTQLNVSLARVVEKNIYPNPFSDLLYLYVTEPGERLEVVFTDLSGRQVKRIVQPVSMTGLQEIHVSGLASGVYIVNILYKKEITKRILVRNAF